MPPISIIVFILVFALLGGLLLRDSFLAFRAWRHRKMMEKAMVALAIHKAMVAGEVFFVAAFYHLRGRALLPREAGKAVEDWLRLFMGEEGLERVLNPQPSDLPEGDDE